MTGRRRRIRCIGFDPSHRCFKPCGSLGRELKTVTLWADELEALRLADLEGLYHEECAQRMGISRTTLSRTLAKARRKVTETLIEGRRLIVADSQGKTLATHTSDDGRESEFTPEHADLESTHAGGP